ncbi:MAG TPA: ATP-binding protein [Lachnospiraceae bacterium]|nr:ATP-binding protein [Lachnospiraceae bacterium]HPF29040.1 ATP-binding protein [Lachnospiraceae bacterium]
MRLCMQCLLILTFVRVQNGGLTITPVLVDVKQCLCENLFSFYEDFKNREIEPKVELPEEACYAMLDPSLLTRIYENILKNALVHGDLEIAVSLVCREDVIILNVRNHTTEEHSKDPAMVFERFYQSDKARNHQSTGLGLCIAKELTIRMGGSIRAYYENDLFGIEIIFQQANRSQYRNEKVEES